MKYNNPEPVSVLVVDDESYIVEMLSSYLVEHGYRVEGFTNPLEALERYRQKTFDLIVTDLKMDEMSGTELVDQIRQKNADTLIIIMTGFASIQSAIRAIQQEVYDYLQKPFKLAEINAVVGRAAEKLLLQRENEALRRRIDQMLADITLLYDVSNILYQVPAYETAMDMVLDTLSEGIDITSAAIFKYDETHKRFAMTHCRGIWDALEDGFGFQSDSECCGNQISVDHATVISNPAAGWSFDGIPLTVDTNLEHCILIPIQFHNRTVGYLGVFNATHLIYDEDETIKLFSVLATQMAPLFHSRSVDYKSDKVAVDQVIKSGPLLVQDTLTSLASFENYSFLLMKLVSPNTSVEEDSSLPEIDVDHVFEPAKAVFSGEGVTLRQYFDTLFVGVRNWNLVSLELSQEKARSRIEASLLEQTGENRGYSVVMATVNFPRDGANSADLYRLLVNRLLMANSSMIIN